MAMRFCIVNCMIYEKQLGNFIIFPV